MLLKSFIRLKMKLACMKTSTGVYSVIPQIKRATKMDSFWKLRAKKPSGKPFIRKIDSRRRSKLKCNQFLSPTTILILKSKRTKTKAWTRTLPKLTRSTFRPVKATPALRSNTASFCGSIGSQSGTRPFTSANRGSADVASIKSQITSRMSACTQRCGLSSAQSAPQLSHSQALSIGTSG